jgi:thiamine-monophosphate kinase
MESDLIAWLRERLPSHPCLRLGPGDDAAILDLGSQAGCVVTTDLLTDGVDFVIGEVDAKRVGHKALAVNLSDLAAMASRPLAAVVALALPRRGGQQLAIDLYEGMLPLADRFDLAIAGGDTNSWDGPLVISVTAIGCVTDHGPLTRSGATPGDRIVVTGALGGSILGKHLDVEPRVAEALVLNERYEIHALIDISDGLAVDLAHVTTESGCGAVIDTGAVPISDAAHELAGSNGDGRSALDHALSDGEDFELLMAAAPAEAERMLSDAPLDVPLTVIGEFTTEPGLWQTIDGKRRPLAANGFEHRFD